ncbi:lipase, partial [Streptomyces sp. SID7982]|nr:lipase [Streptomyces sp. SID7982]
MKFPPPLSPPTCFTHLTHPSRLTRLPALPRLPGPRLSSALLGATALELFVLTGRLIAYPFGLTPERGGTGPVEAEPPASTDTPTTATTATTA